MSRGQGFVGDRPTVISEQFRVIRKGEGDRQTTGSLITDHW